MRQLELFGSFFDTSSDGNVQEKPLVSKTEGAGNEQREAKEVVEITDSQLQKEEESSAYMMPTLFDDSHLLADPAPASVETDEQETPDIAEYQSEIIEVVNDAAAVAHPTVSSISTFSATETMLNRKVAIKSKKQQQPELGGKGSVIFDDGKITVKIKSRPEPVVVKEKPQKVKRPPQKRGRKSFKEIDAEVDLIDIPEDEILFQKQYYPISEVAKWFRVNTSLLRFWENEFDVLKPRKNRKGDRLFRPEDVKNLQLIYQLLRQRKYTIEGAKEYIKTNKKKADIQAELTSTLQKFRSFLLDLKANLQP